MDSVDADTIVYLMSQLNRVKLPNQHTSTPTIFHTQWDVFQFNICGCGMEINQYSSGRLCHRRKWCDMSMPNGTMDMYIVHYRTMGTGGHNEWGHV